MTKNTNKKDKKTDSISRRDFLNGCAISAVAGTAISPMEAIAQGLVDQNAIPLGYYPPSLQGLRGSHEGSFEVAHSFRDGQTWQAVDTGEQEFDLVVVGGGISGLSAAYFFRKQHGPESRILILDNHDDFGGHAKRNESTFAKRGKIGQKLAKFSRLNRMDRPVLYELSLFASFGKR